MIHSDRSNVNPHGVLTPDHLNVQWPLPTMFGEESYAFSLIDITDPRFTAEAADMSHKLLHLYYDLQIVEHEWRRTYKTFLEAEERKEKLTPGVLPKSREKAEIEYNAAKEQLLRLQDQRDLYDDTIQKVFDRCRQIKESIVKERHLDSLCEELHERIKEIYPSGHEFWRASFDVKHIHRKEHALRKHESNMGA